MSLEHFGVEIDFRELPFAKQQQAEMFSKATRQIDEALFKLTELQNRVGHLNAEVERVLAKNIGLTKVKTAENQLEISCEPNNGIIQASEGSKKHRGPMLFYVLEACLAIFKKSENPIKIDQNFIDQLIALKAPQQTTTPPVNAEEWIVNTKRYDDHFNIMAVWRAGKISASASIGAILRGIFAAEYQKDYNASIAIIVARGDTQRGDALALLAHQQTNRFIMFDPMFGRFDRKYPYIQIEDNFDALLYRIGILWPLHATKELNGFVEIVVARAKIVK